ncbi:MAG: ankyrin repeat domain-containing protein [Proteobacteria bacterium]|nr:ankyrin repeat domain-containing protein [Pseudomonadota bacterium]
MLVAVASPAEAQFSKGYKFLEAVRDKDGQAVTDALAEPGTQIINTRDSSSGDTALHIVTARRDVTWMGFLISKGADVNSRNSKGESPMAVASNMGFVDGVQLLLQQGARVDEPSGTGETPLIAAVHRHDLAMMRVLLKAGANPDRADNSGRTARDYALLDGKNSPLLAVIVSDARAQSTRKQGSYGPKL